MVTILTRRAIKNDIDGNYLCEASGLSTDAKPTEYISANSLFLELDTGVFYYFDGTEWKKVGE